MPAAFAAGILTLFKEYILRGKFEYIISFLVSMVKILYNRTTQKDKIGQLFPVANLCVKWYSIHTKYIEQMFDKKEDYSD